MDKRILGPGELEVSALGFGCMGMSQSFGPNPSADTSSPAGPRMRLSMSCLL